MADPCAHKYIRDPGPNATCADCGEAVPTALPAPRQHEPGDWTDEAVFNAQCEAIDKHQREHEDLKAKLEAARGLLTRIVKYAREDRARTPGHTRFERALVETERFLATPAEPKGPRETEEKKG